MPIDMLVAYLPSPHASDWFAHFARAFVSEHLSNTYPCDIATPMASCGNTSFPIYHTTKGQQITLHPYTLALENTATQKHIIFTSHYRPMDLFRTYGFDLDDLCALYTAHHNDHLSLELKELLVLEGFQHHDRVNIQSKIKPWMFRPQSWETLKPFEAAYDPERTKPLAYFRGVMNRGRQCIEHLTGLAPFDIHCGTFHQAHKLEETDYHATLLQYRLALSLPGAGDLCHRDIECLALGIPMIRPKITANLICPIPDEAYISVDYEKSQDYLTNPEFHKPWHPKDPKQLALDLQSKALDVMEDWDYLRAVSRAGYRYYLEHHTWPQPARRALGLVQRHWQAQNPD